MNNEEVRKYLENAKVNLVYEIARETDEDRKSTLKINLQDIENSLKMLDEMVDL